jgi:small subunit ribosomal protein S2
LYQEVLSVIEVPIKPLLETGVHFGHQPRRWNPEMESYIFTERKGVHIIDLEQTMEAIKEVTHVVTQRVAEGDTVLFVGTKRQAQDSIQEHAKRCGMPYVNHRWLGGTLTNFKTIRKSVDKLKELERMDEENIMERLSNKEARRKEREKNRLKRNLEGIRDMESLPDMLFITDLIHENIAVSEARKLDIPITGILDTNCSPDDVDHGIPGNDDAIRALTLYSEIIADAVIDGKELRQEKLAEQQAAMQAEEVDDEELETEAEVVETADGEEQIDDSADEEVEADDSEEASNDEDESDDEETSEEETADDTDESDETEEEEEAEVVET